MRKNRCYFYIIACIFFVLYAATGMYLQERSGLFIHSAIIWNLFLAILPMLFLELFLYIRKKEKTPLNKGLSVLFFLAWILLFPNVPYLITDMIHISPLIFYVFTEEGAWYVRDIMPWLQLCHIAIGVISGLLFGYRSLYHMHNYMIQNHKRLISWLFVLAICLASGYGVYLGRFLRLNSWDILHPIDLICEIVKNTELFAFEFTLVFAGFVYISYLMYYCICERGKIYENDICK